MRRPWAPFVIVWFIGMVRRYGMEEEAVVNHSARFLDRNYTKID
jgi:hypothetical protein